ncbi:MAG TPA: prepilin-type N-terminal cleavage/methylation domain-containing protein [Candidatus Methylomirabilis sp.]|nr:prepilin-type N-terminal cleavage/methylation domain-containing protein [Candidatus Methylomirabilis sp.]
MKKQSGFTLIEFMIATAVTLLALSATVMAFKDALRTNQNVTLKSDVSDNMRAGLNLMEGDLIQAGEGIPTGGIPYPYTPGPASCLGSGGAPINRPNLTGGLTFPVCNVSLNAVEPGYQLGPPISSPDAGTGANTDMISILYADNTLAMNARMINEPAVGSNPGCPAGSITNNGQTVTFDPTCIQFSPTGVQINPGDLIMFSNAKGNAIQEVTSVSGQVLYFSGGDGLNLNARTDPQGTMVQLENTNVGGTPNGTFPPTTATRIWMVTYYLDNITAPPNTRLIRRVNNNPGQPVGETIESLQFRYNFVDGVTNPSGQPSIPTGESESEIRSVDITLGARSTTPWSQDNKYLRNNFTTQVSLRSMAYVNRYH